MPRYKLLAGQHEQADRSKPILGPDGKPTGRFQLRKYAAGDAVESDIDLVAKFGPQHFEALGGQAEADRIEIEKLKAKIAQLEAKQGAETAGGFRTPGDPTPENLAGSPSRTPAGLTTTGFHGDQPEGAKATRDIDAEYPNLDQMNLAELKDVAEAEEIDLSDYDVRRKDDVLKAIRGHK